MTTHTVGQQQPNVSQQGSSAKTKPVVRRIGNSEPIIFDLREKDDEVEDHRIRVIHFYIGDADDDDDDDDDDDEPEKGGCDMAEVEGEKPKMRRVGEERDFLWPSSSTVEQDL